MTTESVAQRAPITFPPRVPMLLQTTPRLLREHSACADGYRKAIKGAGIGPDDKDTPINLLSILESNGLADFHWALHAVLPEQEAARDRVARLMAAEYAARVLPIFEADHPDDERPRLAIEAARDFALGEIRAAARAAAWAAAEAAAGAAAWAAAEQQAQRDIITAYLRAE